MGRAVTKAKLTDDEERLVRLQRAQEKTDKEDRRQVAVEKYESTHMLWAKGDKDWDDVVEAWGEIGEAEGEFGGVPMPTDVPLCLESTFPYDQFHGAHDGKFADQIKHERQQLDAYHLWEQAGRPEGDGREFWLEAGEYIKDPKKKNPKHRYQFVNRWHSDRLRGDITIWYDQEEKKYFHRIEEERWQERLDLLIKTNFTGRVWSLRAEQKAQEKLKKHLKREQFREYMLSGCFLEDSKRTKLRYLFRKSRPTIVFSPNRNWDVLCCLCQHGTGYYARTWAGVLTPTDDVIIHLMQMRTDEYGYWKHSNHHPPSSALSGV
jgi:hypothetical protein